MNAAIADRISGGVSVTQGAVARALIPTASTRHPRSAI
jgi:hypothetical protein